MDEIAAFLIERETITGKEFMEILHKVEGTDATAKHRKGRIMERQQIHTPGETEDAGTYAQSFRSEHRTEAPGAGQSAAAPRAEQSIATPGTGQSTAAPRAEQDAETPGAGQSAAASQTEERVSPAPWLGQNAVSERQPEQNGSDVSLDNDRPSEDGI